MHERPGYELCSGAGEKVLVCRWGEACELRQYIYFLSQEKFIFIKIISMKSISYEQAPLTADEKDMLLTVYDQRRRLIFVVYTIFFALIFALSGRIDIRARYSNGVVRWEENNEDAKYVSRFWMKMINFAFLETIVMSTGVYFWMKRVRPLKKDADMGVKEGVPYEIVKKEYFAVSGQYFFDIDDPAYLHHEVDEDTYNKLNEGDYFYIFRGVHSKFVFEENGRYTIL
jgi:hypothetical protein